jgi:hypothetical protein
VALDADRIATNAKSKLATLLEAAGLSSGDAADAAEKAIDNLGVAIIEALVEDIQANAETSGGETIS